MSATPWSRGARSSCGACSATDPVRLIAFLLGGLLLAAPAQADPLPDPWDAPAAAYVVTVDGVPRWGRAVEARLPPASLTKLLSALVILDHDWQPDAVVTVSATAAGIGGTRLGLKPGERMRAGDLLAAMLVRSANDACTALAEHAAGSVAAFVDRMNARAAALGLAASRFATPCGFDAPGHLSTASDLVTLSAAAMAHPEIARLVALPSVEVERSNGRRVALANTNQLIGRIDGVVGVKTGFTSKAGRCLIAQATRGGRSVTVVLLDAGDRWWTAAAMIEDAFDAVLAGQ